MSGNRNPRFDTALRVIELVGGRLSDLVGEAAPAPKDAALAERLARVEALLEKIATGSARRPKPRRKARPRAGRR